MSSIATSVWSGGDNNTFNEDGSIASSTKAFGGIGGEYAQSSVGTIAFGTVMGGAGAALTGGNFWQGAVTGLIVSTFNHVMHGDNDGPGDPTGKYRRFFRKMSKLSDNLPIVDSNFSAVYHY